MYKIYKHENLITHQVYIGITNQIPENRQGEFGRGYKNQTKFFDAILEYGQRNFSHVILFDNIKDIVTACRIETQLIEKYDSIKNGYNSCISINEDEDNVEIKYIDIQTKEIYSTKKEIAEALNLSPSAITRYFSRPEQNICQGHIILNKNEYDKMTEQEINNLKNSLKIPKIQCIETGEIFENAELAGNKYSDKKGSKSYILKACKTGQPAYKKHQRFI